MPSVRVFSALIALASLVLFLWTRHRARSRPGRPIPSLAFALVPLAVLVGTVPAVLWPADTRVRGAASILSIVLTVVALVLLLRRPSSHRERPL